MFKELLSWSDDQHSHLIWRRERSLYMTLVSEIMLQQTTVSTVSNHIEKFLKKYPDLETLSATTEEEVCIAWKGLGYYRRARNLLNAAKDIKTKHGGEIPTTISELKEIKGIGDYTANAIVGIGANLRALAVDANLERVIARFYGIETLKGPKLQKEIYTRFYDKEILPQIRKGNSRKINEAFMDLGRVICQARKADCVLCPIKKNCVAFKENTVLSIPNKPQKKEVKFELDLVRVIVSKKNQIIGYVKSDKEWLQGQVELPTFVIRSEDKSLKQYPKTKNKFDLKNMKSYKTSITKYKINNYILEVNQREFKKLFTDLKSYNYFLNNDQETNFSTATIKALKLCKGI